MWKLLLGWFIGWYSMGILIIFLEWYYKRYKHKCISCERELGD